MIFQNWKEASTLLIGNIHAMDSTVKKNNLNI